MSEQSQTAWSWPDVLRLLVRRIDLPTAAATWAMNEIMHGAATDAQLAAFAVALRAKGETSEEVDGLIDAMYANAVPFETDTAKPALDIVGTGGDGAHTVNISTMAAIVAAGAGARVVKHGNRSASSTCGTADVLEELGIRLDIPPQRVVEIADEVGITFCYAPMFHPSLRHAAGPRRELGVATTFNFLGPIANPAHPTAQAVGVTDPHMAQVLAGVLARRGVSALVFRGDDGLDELTTTTTSQVHVICDGTVEQEQFDPQDVNITRSTLEDLRGGDASDNAIVVRGIMDGQRGPIRDAVLLNAAAGLAAWQSSTLPLTQRIADALTQAAESIDSGKAADVLERWIAAVNS